MQSVKRQPHERASRLSHCLQALESKDFRLYLTGQAFSAIGTGMQNVALAWLVYRLTHSAVTLGLFAASIVLPQVLLSLAAGCMADGKNKKLVLYGLQVAGASVASMLLMSTFLPGLNHYVVLALAFVYGAFTALEYPARHAFTGRIVPSEKLVSARGLYSATCASTLALGQLIAGFIIETGGEWGERACFLLNLVSYLVALILLRRVNLRVDQTTFAKEVSDRRPPRKTNVSPGSSTSSLEKSGLKYCLQYAFGSKVLLVSFVQTTILVLFCLRYITFLPAFASEVFHGGAGAAGLLSAALAIGYAAAAFVCGGSRNADDLSKLASWSLVLLPISLVLFSLSPNLTVGVVCVLLMAFFQSANINANVATMQVSSPDWIFGRLMGLRITIIAVLELVGALVASQMVGLLGLPGTMITAAAISIVFTGLLASGKLSLTQTLVRSSVPVRSTPLHGKD